MLTEHSHCRACGAGGLVEVVDLGRTALANDFISPSRMGLPAETYPLRLVLCQECSLAQLDNVVDPQALYANYNYITSTSRTMRDHLDAQARFLLAEVGIEKPRVLEVASNTGEYLKRYQAAGCCVIGIEPALNIVETAGRNLVPTRPHFFDERTAPKIVEEWGVADLVVARHVFAHIDDWKGFVRALRKVTHEQSLVAIEVPYLLDLFNRCEFDSIYHEHLSYVSVLAMHHLLAGTGFKLHRVDRLEIHGGSILLQLRRDGFLGEQHPGVKSAIHIEDHVGLGRLSEWKPFTGQVKRVRQALPKLVRQLRKEGKSVIGYGASAKGNTLLNTCGLTFKDLDCIVDTTPEKQGKLAPGSMIPVVHPEELLKRQPDYALLLAWNFAEEILAKESQYQIRGGRFINPNPFPAIEHFQPVVDSAAGTGAYIGNAR